MAGHTYEAWTGPRRRRAAARTARAALLGLAVSTACARGGEAPPPPAAGRILSVGVGPSATPWEGFDRALFAAVALDLGLRIAWVETRPEAALRELDAGRFDVAAGPFTAGEARGRRLLPAVATRGDALLKRRGDGAILVPADIAGKAVAILQGSADATRLPTLAAGLGARVRTRPSFGAGDLAADLLAGRLAAIAGTLAEVGAAARARPEAFEVVGPPFGPTARLAPALRPGAEATPLATAVAASLGRLRADGRLADLQRLWLGLVLDPPDAPAAAALPPQAPAATTSKP